MPKPKTSKPLVICTWADAHGSATAAYSEHEIPHAPIIIHTLGWLLRDDEVGVTVANEYCADDTWRGCTFVPRLMVRDVVWVSRKPKTVAEGV